MKKAYALEISDLGIRDGMPSMISILVCEGREHLYYDLFPADCIDYLVNPKCCLG